MERNQQKVATTTACHCVSDARNQRQWSVVGCRKHILERRDLMEGMKAAGMTGDAVKNILECGERGHGRRCLFSFLISTGLMRRI